MGLKQTLLTIFCCAAAYLAKADNVTFSYQGAVKVSNQPYTGTGQFKLAIMDTSAQTTLWTNDGTATGEPVASITVPVNEGVFSIVVGDAAAGMEPINASLFASRTPLKLRIWFNADGIGFQQLTPDQNLVDLTLNTVSTGVQDYTIYVDGTNGDDKNNGLTAGTAKKTIQAGFDIIPSQLRCNVTLKIMPGDYYEMVSVHGISASGTLWSNGFEGKFLRVLGDETWTHTSTGDPNVRILGSDTSTGPQVRKYALIAHQCSAVQFEGIWFDRASSVGAKTENGNYIFKNCKATNSSFAGFASITGSFTNYINCLATLNAHGFYAMNASMYVTASSSLANTNFGAYVQGPGTATIYAGSKLNNNGFSGIYVRDNGVLGIGSGSPTVESMSNGHYGLQAITGAVVNTQPMNTTGNSLGSTSTSPGGHIY